jgi:hypothetical protein
VYSYVHTCIASIVIVFRYAFYATIVEGLVGGRREDAPEAPCLAPLHYLVIFLYVQKYQGHVLVEVL